MTAVKATVCETIDAFWGAPPGAIYRGSKDGLMIKCPSCGGESWMDAIESQADISAEKREYLKGRDRQPWVLSGWPSAPTLTPSVIHSDGKCGWHGYLRNGEWVQ